MSAWQKSSLEANTSDLDSRLVEPTNKFTKQWYHKLNETNKNTRLEFLPTIFFIENRGVELKDVAQFSSQSLPSPHWASILVLLLIVSSSRATLALLGVLALHAAGAATAVWRAQGEVDVLLAVQSHHEGWDVHNLLAHTRGRDRRREDRRANVRINLKINKS